MVFGGRIVYKYYIELLFNYIDEDGLDFISKDFRFEEVYVIFGVDIDVYNVNKLLKIIYGCCVVGIFEDFMVVGCFYGYIME